MNAPRTFAILGPTASSKTGLALDIAAKLPVEVISLDPALVYRDMDTGTAKLGAAERQAVLHRLIGIAIPLGTYSATDFAADCVRLIADVHRHRQLLLIVGGIMMYFQAPSGGLNNLSEADPAVRTVLQAEKDVHGLARLYRRLWAADPVTVARLKPNDNQRIERVLEVLELTGKPLSRHLDEQQATPSSLGLHTIALIPENHILLHVRIAERFGQMLWQDFFDGMVTLRRKYPALTVGYTSMCYVGYHQVWGHIEGGYGHEAFVERGTAAIRQFVERQLTWLREIPLAQSPDPFTVQNYLQTASEPVEHHFGI